MSNEKAKRVGDLPQGETFKWAEPLPDENPDDVMVVVRAGRGTDSRGEYENASTDIAWTSDLGSCIPARMATASDQMVIPLGQLIPANNGAKKSGEK